MFEGCFLDRLENGVAVLTITNPRRRNCLSVVVESELIAHLEALTVDETCRAVVLTGEGPYFCAGGDLSRMAGSDTKTALAALKRLHKIVLLIDELGAPVLAAIEGGAAGGGLAIAAACDFVIASSDAQLAMAFDRIGLAPDLGAMWTFERRIGLGATRRLSYLGGTLPAAEAHWLGLVDEVTPPKMAKHTALELASDITKRSATANASIKRALARPPLSLRAALEIELQSSESLYSSEQYRAFVEGLDR